MKTLKEIDKQKILDELEKIEGTKLFYQKLNEITEEFGGDESNNWDNTQLSFLSEKYNKELIKNWLKCAIKLKKEFSFFETLKKLIINFINVIKFPEQYQLLHWKKQFSESAVMRKLINEEIKKLKLKLKNENRNKKNIN